VTHASVLPGSFGVAERKETVEAIAALQEPSGCILWAPGDHADPWNHVEAAMALTLGGHTAEAERAYRWLAATQAPDGSWPAYTHADGRVKDPNFDANVGAYVAVGVWQHHRETGDEGFLVELWPVVERAVECVLTLQQPGGEILWARRPDGTAFDYALLTGSSSMHMSIRCALAVAGHLGLERPHWEQALLMLRAAITTREDAFSSRDRWAMDWYYPILGGALRGGAAVRRVGMRWEQFVVPGRGVRCVHDRPWVTAAETCELVMALCAIDAVAHAQALFDWVQALRTPEGLYHDGWVWPEEEPWPERRSSWTAAAVVLAADCLDGLSETAAIFRGDDLPLPPDPLP
jgi:hypothetical protein